MPSPAEQLVPDAQRIERDLMELATIRDPGSPGWTREVFSEPYRSSREWVSATMREVGLDVRRDRTGNLVGVLHGARPDAPALVTGSHTDTVQGGGRFDGVVGVLGALELVRQLRERDIELTRDLVVVDFLGEESNDFGLSCLGSRALAAELTPADLDRANGEGVRLGDRYAAFGVDPSGVLAADWARRIPLYCYVELHVEQGPLLERKGTPIGVVTAIAGIERLLATFSGRPDHAGTRPMDDRRDAMVAAAEAVLAIEREGCGAPVHGVATTTRLTAQPDSPNVVPGTVRLRAEMRSIDPQWLTTARRRLVDDILARARARGVDVDFQWTRDNDTVSASSEIHAALARAADDNGLTWTPVPSGATHDAVHLARLCPMGMVFIPSRAGRSHCPEEWSGFDDIAAGVQVLGSTLLALDQRERVS
jgi:beta-ureidopropionase / N-carbamoyl-L-amino-acid hydrolase